MNSNDSTKSNHLILLTALSNNIEPSEVMVKSLIIGIKLFGFTNLIGVSTKVPNKVLRFNDKQ
jgi:hypothetical protein